MNKRTINHILKLKSDTSKHLNTNYFSLEKLKIRKIKHTHDDYRL